MSCVNIGHMASGDQISLPSSPPLSGISEIDDDIVRALANRRITLVSHLLAWPEADLARSAGVTREAIQSACRAVHMRYGARRWSGVDLLAEESSERKPCRYLRPELQRCSVWNMCRAYPGDLVEIAGGPGSGKTQMCLTVAAAVAGSGQGVVLLDSSGSLDCDRVCDIMTAWGFNKAEIEKSVDLILVIPVPTVESADIALRLLIGDILSTSALFTSQFDNDDIAPACPVDILSDRFTETHPLKDLGLVVFDSPATLLGPVLGWRWPDGWTGYAFSSKIAGQLRELAKVSNAVILTTNRLLRGEYDVDRRAALGRSWSHLSDTRIFLDEAKGDLAAPEGSFFTRRISSRRSGAVDSTLLRLTPRGVIPERNTA
jgi:RAD51-like protein 3